MVVSSNLTFAISQSNSVVECLRKKPAKSALVAQWLAYKPSKLGVAGSSPAVGNSFLFELILNTNLKLIFAYINGQCSSKICSEKFNEKR